MVFARRRWGWDPKGRGAVAAYTTFGLMVTNRRLRFGICDFRGGGRPPRDSVHSYALRFQAGAVYFVHPWLGKHFDNDIRIGFAFLGFYFLVMWVHRDEVTRYD